MKLFRALPAVLTVALSPPLCRPSAAASPEWYKDVYGGVYYNGQTILKDAAGVPFEALSNPPSDRVSLGSAPASVQPPVVVVQATGATTSGLNMFDNCYVMTTNNYYGANTLIGAGTYKNGLFSGFVAAAATQFAFVGSFGNAAVLSLLSGTGFSQTAYIIDAGNDLAYALYFTSIYPSNVYSNTNYGSNFNAAASLVAAVHDAAPMSIRKCVP